MSPKNYFFSLIMVSITLTGCGDSADKAALDTATTAEQAVETEIETGGMAPDMLALPDEPPSARLPAGIAPTHYTVHLDIDPRQELFTGSTRIDIELAGQTNYLWLHGIDLDITSAVAMVENGESIVLNWEQMAATGAVKLTAASVLPAGKSTLQFEYTAPFNTNLEGLYKVGTGDDAYVYTQFEATSARLAFPSFDEPGFKVTFDVSLTIPEDYVGISNTPQVSETPVQDGMRTLTFATTKPLPTYLVAFAVGTFDVVEWEPVTASGLRKNPIPLRGITTRGKGDQIRFALENTADLVLELEDYFDTPYPYAKLDIIAVPDFSAGAMENAGAITYREEIILLDENASVGQKRGFFSTHAHELAHQWFGNLVTPVWWDDIWLNESFATWNAYIILDRLFPDENYRDALQNSVSRVMSNDSLASARQIREPINRHEDIGSAFNGITYQKGGGVLSMFESFLGRDNFRDGIRHYMKTFAFGNTTAEDFIGAIADANPQIDGQDLRDAFDSFIEQAGLPVISSTLSCTEKGVQLQINQQRYLPVGSEGSIDQSWTIPACFSAIEGGKFSSQCFLLKDRTQTVQLNTERCPDAILPNTGGNSYYRWSLPPAQWQSLMQYFDELSITEQISVANSLSAALNNGSMPLSDYLIAVPAIIRSDSWRVAIAPRDDLYKIKEFVANDEERLQLEAKLREWYQPQLDRLNALPERRPDQEQFRMLSMSTLALGAKDPVVRAQLAESGTAYVGFEGDEKIHPEAIDPNLIMISLLVSVEEYGKPYTDLLWRLFQTSDNALVRQYLLIALGESTDPVTVKSRLCTTD
jgi:alanyl aminopeptidase